MVMLATVYNQTYSFVTLDATPYVSICNATMHFLCLIKSLILQHWAFAQNMDHEQQLHP
jgi:hypothetical protein